MAKSPSHPHGRSSNAVATEADVPLRTLQDFVKSGGSPAKYNNAAQVGRPLREVRVYVCV